MNSVATNVRLTPEDLLSLPDSVDYELVDGQLVERHMGAVASWVAATVAHLLKTGSEPEFGWVFGADCGYECFANSPGKIRKPDVSFIRRERLANGIPKGYVRIAPDLAVEVLSPHDLATEVDEKVLEYLEAGVRLVWIVNPELRRVRVHRADGSIAELGAEGELSGEEVLPGFRCRVSSLFPVEEAAEEMTG